MRHCLVAEDAVQLDAEPGGAAFRGGHPWADLPWRIVTNVLAVPASKLGYPVPFVILVESNDRLVHCAWAPGLGTRLAREASRGFSQVVTGQVTVIGRH